MAKLFLGNLPWETNEQDIRNFFAPMIVNNVRIVTDRATGKSRGFAFVDVRKEDEETALSFNRADFGGRSCVVNKAIEKKPEDRRRNQTYPGHDR